MDTKALRQKILDLAIRGKLVPQDPNDEPASVLLERIRAEKQQMVKEGKLKPKDIKNDTVIFKGDDNLHYEQFQDGTVKCIEDEIPFELPDGWEWCRIRNIASVKGGKRLPKGESFSDDVTDHVYIRVTDMKNRTINTFGLKYISEEVFAKIQSYTIGKNDLYVTIAGTIGVVGEVPEILDGMNLTENAVKVCNISINKTFLCYVMLSELVQQQFQDKTHQVAMPKLALERILGTLIPVCPVKEQQLIVFSIKSALQIADTIEIQKDTLFELVSATKSKILDLAIRGKLVPQDPNDEPASVLLERIRAEKEELIKQGKIKRDKKESVIFKGDDNSYYIQTGSLIEELGDWSLNCLPDSWGICCLGEVCDYGSCVNVGTDCIEDNAWILDLEDIEKDTGRVIKKVKKSERSAMSTKHSFKKGQVLYSKLRPYLNKVVLADEDGYCTSEILPLDFNSLVLPAYARYYLMTPAFLAYANRCSYGVKMPRLSTSDGKKAVMTIPPLAEQKRIVAAIETYYSKLDKIAEMLT
jgi:type I restriction enzyme S subunit